MEKENIILYLALIILVLCLVGLALITDNRYSEKEKLCNNINMEYLYQNNGDYCKNNSMAIPVIFDCDTFPKKLKCDMVRIRK